MYVHPALHLAGARQAGIVAAAWAGWLAGAAAAGQADRPPPPPGQNILCRRVAGRPWTPACRGGPGQGLGVGRPTKRWARVHAYAN